MKDNKVDVKDIVDQEKSDVFNSGVMQALDDLDYDLEQMERLYGGIDGRPRWLNPRF